MSVIVKGMEMPKNCYSCWLGHKCPKYEDLLWNEISKERKADCPLVPIPPHGRLIDADKLGLTDFEIVMCDGNYKKGLEMLAKKIEDASTVIPADKDGET